MKTITKVSILLGLGFGLTAIISSTKVLNVINQVFFDLLHDNKTVFLYEKSDSLLATFDRVGFEDLAPDYLSSTGFDRPYYRGMMENEKFYLIGSKDIYWKIAGDTRIKDLLPKDHSLWAAIRYSTEQLYWLVDTCLIHQLVNLNRALILNKYDHRAIKVISGYRYPLYNEAVRGAKNSMHIRGKAVDIRIGDVDMDGKYTAADKQIIYRLLDREILGDTGGIGNYQHTRSIHFDVRVKLARWE